MKLLIVDTSTNVFSVAVSVDGVLLGERCGAQGDSTTALLATTTATLLSGLGLMPSDMDGFAVTIGPGAFTGLRVGVGFVKGLAHGVGKKVVGISSLELLAMNAQGATIPVCPMLDARKSEVYSALFRWEDGFRVVIPEAARAPSSWLEQFDGPAIFLGDGAVRYRAEIVSRFGKQAHFITVPELNQPHAAAGIVPALRQFAADPISPAHLLPRYLRLSEAELNRQ